MRESTRELEVNGSYTWICGKIDSNLKANSREYWSEWNL